MYSNVIIQESTSRNLTWLHDLYQPVFVRVFPRVLSLCVCHVPFASVAPPVQLYDPPGGLLTAPSTASFALPAALAVIRFAEEVTLHLKHLHLLPPVNIINMLGQKPLHTF